MKYCSQCEQRKPFDAFHRKGKGYQSWCKDCRRDWNRRPQFEGKSYNAVRCRRAYEKNPQAKVREQVERAKRRKITLVRERGGACERCGYSRSYNALQFHHRDPATKEFEIGVKFTSYGLDRLRREADKCDLLCANCHFEEHDPAIMEATGEYIA